MLYRENGIPPAFICKIKITYIIQHVTLFLSKNRKCKNIIVISKGKNLSKYKCCFKTIWKHVINN